MTTGKQAPPGPRWANVANTPFQYWKAESYEGGVHTPFIVYWPAGLTVKPGSTTNQLGHIMDIMATLTDVAGAHYPTTYKGRKITPTEGKTLTPILKGKQRPPHDALFNEHYGACYVRTGEWKMSALAKDTVWHLYHIATDQTELHDVAAEHPGIVKRLDSLWRAWAIRTNVYPKP